ncbi:hypothetical protein EBP35_25985 [Salmonella enterica subsp. enterica serovar Antsalova]|nr:hypothetical protein [Salmonella enterica subsp. enterica serovar Antsalova]
MRCWLIQLRFVRLPFHWLRHFALTFPPLSLTALRLLPMCSPASRTAQRSVLQFQPLLHWQPHSLLMWPRSPPFRSLYLPHYSLCPGIIRQTLLMQSRCQLFLWLHQLMPVLHPEQTA